MNEKTPVREVQGVFWHTEKRKRRYFRKRDSAKTAVFPNVPLDHAFLSFRLSVK